MAGMKGLGKTITTKALPAAGGGAAASVFNKLLGSKIAAMLPESVAPLANAVPAVIGLYLMGNKSQTMQFAGAGMIGKVTGDLGDAYIPLGDDVLADAAEELDELFDEDMGDDYNDDEDDFDPDNAV